MPDFARTAPLMEKMSRNLKRINGKIFTRRDIDQFETPYMDVPISEGQHEKRNTRSNGGPKDTGSKDTRPVPPAERKTKNGLAFFTKRSKKSCFYHAPFT